MKDILELNTWIYIDIKKKNTNKLLKMHHTTLQLLFLKQLFSLTMQKIDFNSKKKFKANFPTSVSRKLSCNATLLHLHFVCQIEFFILF